jgi:hypothetical protein
MCTSHAPSKRRSDLNRLCSDSLTQVTYVRCSHDRSLTLALSCLLSSPSCCRSNDDAIIRRDEASEASCQWREKALSASASRMRRSTSDEGRPPMRRQKSLNSSGIMPHSPCWCLQRPRHQPSKRRALRTSTTTTSTQRHRLFLRCGPAPSMHQRTRRWRLQRLQQQQQHSPRWRQCSRPR